MRRATIIKQKAVTSLGHGKNLRSYINDDRKVLLRDSQNMEECRDIKRWAWYMKRTRERNGHDKASRKGKDGKRAWNTILYHQILGFNPDECDVNGGKLSPEDCMRYAEDDGTYYPNQEVVLALHNEYCKEDGTHRYAVHMVINRTDLVTKKRLAEGRGESAKQRRAKRVPGDGRALGTQGRGARQGQREGSQEAAIQAGEGDRRARRRVVQDEPPELCRLAATRATDIVEYRDLLDRFGVETEFSVVAGCTPQTATTPGTPSPSRAWTPTLTPTGWGSGSARTHAGATRPRTRRTPLTRSAGHTWQTSSVPTPTTARPRML